MDNLDHNGLQHLDGLPAGLLDVPAEQLLPALGGPGLIHVPGDSDETVFVSVLLHGNETTGWDAVRALLRRHGGGGLRRSLLVFVGNVAAAAVGRRRLAGQSDYNRIWPDPDGNWSPTIPAERPLAKTVMRTVSEHNLYAAVDIHNNSGRNPAHACVNLVEPRHVDLAAMFAPLLLYFTYPPGTLAQSLTGLCPVTTIECGMPGDRAIQRRAEQFLYRLLSEPGIPAADGNLRILRNMATVKVAADAHIGHLSGHADIEFPADLDQWNWREMPAGQAIATLRDPGSMPLHVLANGREDRSARYLTLNANTIVTSRPLIPAMISLDTRIIRQDCLCYLLEPVAKLLSTGE